MIERCLDYRRVKKFPGCSICVSDEVYYLMETKDGVDLGVWSLFPWRDGVSIHADLGPKCRGKDAKESAKSVFKWIFDNTFYKIIYAFIPNNTRPAQIMASIAGMEYMHTESNFRFYKIECDKQREEGYHYA